MKPLQKTANPSETDVDGATLKAFSIFLPEIPLFHVMNACVTFGNVFGIEESVVGVSTIEEIDRLSCVVDDSCFEAPADYVVYGSTGNAATATATRRSAPSLLATPTC